MVMFCNAGHHSVSVVGMERTKRFSTSTHQSLYLLHLARLCWTAFNRAGGFLCSTKRHFWPYWRNSIAQLLQICWLLWCKSLLSTAACQMCLIGWRSGVCGGLLSIVKLCSKKQFEIIGALQHQKMRQCGHKQMDGRQQRSASWCLNDVKRAEIKSHNTTRNPKHWYKSGCIHVFWLYHPNFTEDSVSCQIAACFQFPVVQVWPFSCKLHCMFLLRDVRGDKQCCCSLAIRHWSSARLLWWKRVTVASLFTGASSLSFLLWPLTSTRYIYTFLPGCWTAAHYVCWIFQACLS